MTPVVDSMLVRLRDERYLCVADLGDPAGVPVFFLHGGPGSRRGGASLDAKAKEMGIRLLTPDRPGSGFSEPKPDRTVLDFAHDIADVADALGIGRFGVFGGSGGGPYALACAYELPDRVTLAVVASSPGDGGADPGMRDGYHGPWKIMTWAARTSALLLVPPLTLMLRAPKPRDPDKPMSEKEAAERAAAPLWLIEADDPQHLLDNYQEMRRQGLRQPAEDLHVIFSRWGFDPRLVRGRVQLWHGEQDDAVPVQSGRRLAEQIPGVDAHFVPGGHYVSMFRAEEIFSSLLASFHAAEIAPTA